MNTPGAVKAAKPLWAKAWAAAAQHKGGTNGNAGFANAKTTGALVINSPSYRSQHQM